MEPQWDFTVLAFLEYMDYGVYSRVAELISDTNCEFRYVELESSIGILYFSFSTCFLYVCIITILLCYDIKA